MIVPTLSNGIAIMTSSHVTYLRYILLSCGTLLFSVSFAVGAGPQEDEFESSSDIHKARLAAKPWYVSDTSMFGYTIPISPVSIVITIVALWQLIRGLTRASTAEASHILIKDRAPATKKLLENMKRDIGSDLTKFQSFAQQYSSCPSKDQGGYLGPWKKGVMDPSFDAAVFHPSNPVNTTIGPVETSFGYHLIYIQKRKIA